MSIRQKLSQQQNTAKRRAEKAGLRYVDTHSRGYGRRPRGKGFSYLSQTGETITSDRIRSRIKALAIPPAWQDVWICPSANGHIQATGTDNAGDKQYSYHARWEAIRNATKEDRMKVVASVLPHIRRRLRRDLNKKGMTRERILAAVVRLIDRGRLRIGDPEAAQKTGARGATTLLEEHVELDGVSISLAFPGKSGQQRDIELSDGKLAGVIRKCIALNGESLFSYRDNDGEVQSIAAYDVNEYLADICGESVTAKDFRTWWGSVTALSVLMDADLDELRSKTKRKQASRAAVAEVAQALGNTKSVCRNSYIHAGLLAAMESDDLPEILQKAKSFRSKQKRELTQAEYQFSRLLPDLQMR